jgi:hypothetical protein
VASQFAPRFSRRCTDSAFEELVDRNLMVEMEGRYLSLAIFRQREAVQVSLQRAVGT